MSSPGREFDLQPDPRILPMLGEINLAQWRCIGELIDNSVDGFLGAQRAGAACRDPEVLINLPSSDHPGAQITVRDTGPGMDPGTLEKAVRAGWTGNDPISNLGMFGMGFNIATARLGTVTTVWTSRDHDPEWYGVEIDFERLTRQRHFKTPMLARPKADPREHGTEVIVTRIKPEQRQWFARTANKTKLLKDLGRAYSSMLRPGGVPVAFRLTVGTTQVRGRDHCIWGGEGNPARVVETARYGAVNAFQSIDRSLGDRKFCAACWQWLPAGTDACPACGVAAENVVVRQRRIRGWLGVQRCLSEQEFGIDFLRHGRKIEFANKELFLWTDGEVQELEYPIDDPRHRGRIVGEIHLDHCRVMYTKDRFDRNDPAWDEMVEVVRGKGPLRPDKAEQLGCAPNESPLFRLYQAFRRSSPKPKVAGSYARLLVVPENDRATEYAKRFYAGDPDYQTDAKWQALVDEADRALLRGGEPAATQETLEGFPVPPEPAGPTTVEPEDGTGGGRASAPPTPRTPISSLTQEYKEDRTDYRWNIRAFVAERSDPAFGGRDLPWKLIATPSGVFDLLVVPDHRVFASATLTSLDGLLAELAHHTLDRQRGTADAPTYAEVLHGLRARYARTSALDPVELSAEASATLTATARSLRRQVTGDDGRALFEELAPSEQDAIQERMAGRAVRQPQQVINEGRFLEHAPRRTLVGVIQRHPDLFFDGKWWTAPYVALDYGREAVTEDARRAVLRHYVGLLEDAIWLEDTDPGEASALGRSRLLRAALALELLTAARDAEAED
ncbi:MAG: ATP-binding protein [Deltaproteobacteria bacterium]|nr:ATP-binding protein [Deltaproteobacteria bacterium]